jgi:hypothetical protein
MKRLIKGDWMKKTMKINGKKIEDGIRRPQNGDKIILIQRSYAKNEND